MGITQIAAWATKTTHLIALYFVVLMYSIFLTIFFNVDRADQLDCRRWRDNIKKAVRNTLRGVDKMNSSNSNNHILENIGFLMYLNAHE